MTPFFNSPARCAALAVEASQWIGTPFVPHGAVKGAGVDCVWLAAELYKATGALREFHPRPYTLGSSQHNSLSQVIEWLDNSPHFTKGVMPFQAGDLIGFKIGKCVHHVGVVVSERTFIHSVQKYGVMESRLDDSSWLTRVAALYRPVEL